MLTFMLLLISHKLLEVFKHTERENKYFLQFFFFVFLKHLPFLMLSSLIGLSLLTWHCPSRHWTSSHGSHLPNHHIHPLQKCQADKVSNFMPALTFKIFFFISTCQTCWACFVLWYQFCLPSYLSSSKPWTTYRENSSKAFASGGCFWEERGKCGP